MPRHISTAVQPHQNTTSMADPVSDENWQVLVKIQDLEKEARSFDLEPDSTHWPQIANDLDLVEIADLRAPLKLHRTKNSIRIRGQVSALVTQTCVVTLEPITQPLLEEIDRTFVTNLEDVEKVLARQNANREVLLDPEELDPPDVLEDGYFDLAALVLEHVALGLELYPRKEDADLEQAARAQGLVTGDADEATVVTDSPFAALAKLKQ